MKKTILPILLLCFVMLCLAGCECKHDFTRWDVTREPTCIKEGERERECKECGLVEKETLTDAVHDSRVVEGYESTCTEQGLSDGRKCILCGEMTTPQTPLELAPHKERKLTAVKATCTKEGLTEGTKCRICEQVITAQETVPMAAHSYEVNAEIPATCLSGGWKEHQTCSVCHKRDIENIEIPIKPHVYANGRCESCGDYENANRDLEFVFGRNGVEIRSIGKCTATEIIVPTTYKDAALASVDSRAFAGNADLKSIIFPDNLKYIGYLSFSYCTSLEYVWLGKEIDNISEKAFDECWSLKKLYYAGTMAEFENQCLIVRDWLDGTFIKEIICSDGTINVG